MTNPSAKRASNSYRCGECGWTSLKWKGRCGECQTWGAIEEVGAAPVSRARPGPVNAPALPIPEVQARTTDSCASGVPELDRVLGGGLVPGSVLLLAGEPGVGKSTLLLEVAAQAARHGSTVLYVSGEESASQVRLRAERTGALEDRLYLAAETDLSAVLSHIDAVEPDLLIIDSIQTVASNDIDGAAGGVTQVRAVTAALVRVAKERHLPTLLVGHVTKDGTVAGPRALEHVVDVVLQFEGERNSRLRVLRAVKNRFGPVDEIGCFDLCDDGIIEVSDPTGLFVSRHPEPMSGTCVTVTLEGRRPLLAEVQSLVTRSSTPQPRRAVSGLDSSRLAMLLAVLQRRVGIQLGLTDVYAATVGGASLRGPAADLAIAISVASAAVDVALPLGMVAIAEVGLAGELRAVPSLAQRLNEAARLGFTNAVIPASHGATSALFPAVEGLAIVECRDLYSALRVLQLVDRPPREMPAELHVVG
ncbi:MAG: DNA repair protein RadA [Nocardioidaceae bacterium]|nr:DNA repair protein RadA [Nocardioidaceae bacterium]